MAVPGALSLLNQNVSILQELSDALPKPPVNPGPKQKYEKFTHREKPVSSKRYFIRNVGRDQWLNLANWNVSDGNPVLSWLKSAPESENETWRITEHEGGNFTIENRTPLLKGVGGYVGIQDKKTVNRSAPFMWKFEEIAGSARVYQIMPVNQEAVHRALASVYDDGLKDWHKAQAALVPENKQDETQQWIFIEAPVTPYGSTDPIHGRNYYIVNVGRERWLDLAGSNPTEGNFIIGWIKNSPSSANQIWNFSGSFGEFTLQNLAVLKMKGVIGGNDGNVEGHIHIENEKTVIGPESFKWKLEPVGNSLYKIHPVNRPEMSLACVTEQLNSVPGCAAQLEPTKAKDDTQHWAFIPAIELV